MSTLLFPKSRTGMVLAACIAALAINICVAQDPASPFEPKADANRGQLRAHIEKLKRLPPAQRAQGYGAGMVTAAERLIADDPPASLKAYAVLHLMDGLHYQAANENNAEADTKLAETAQQYANDADKRVATAANFFLVEAKVLKADDTAPAEIPALLDEVKTALKGKRPDAKYGRLALSVTKAINRIEDNDEKEKQFKEFGRIFSGSNDRELAQYGNQMKSLQLVGAAPPAEPANPGEPVDWTGKPMVLAGRTADGKQFDIAQYKGKVVLVDFWATWCGPCRALMPHVKEMHAKYNAQGFEVVGVSLDRDLNALNKYVREEQIPWVNVIGQMQGGKVVFPIAQAYGVTGIPTTFLVDQEGKIVSRNARGERLVKQVEQLLAADPAKKTAQAD